MHLLLSDIGTDDTTQPSRTRLPVGRPPSEGIIAAEYVPPRIPVQSSTRKGARTRSASNRGAQYVSLNCTLFSQNTTQAKQMRTNAWDRQRPMPRNGRCFTPSGSLKIPTMRRRAHPNGWEDPAFLSQDFWPRPPTSQIACEHTCHGRTSTRKILV